MRALAKDLEPSLVLSPTVILNDNKGAIDLSNNSGYRPRTKHIDTHHFIKEKLDSSEIKIEYIPTEMTADVLTKGLFAPKFKDCIKNMGLVFF